MTTSRGKINAAVIPAQGADFEFQELDLDGPRDDEVLVRVIGPHPAKSPLSHGMSSPHDPRPSASTMRSAAR